MTTHVLTVRDVPVDGFWSISVYNEDGYFQKNALDVYSINSLTAKPSADGAYRIQFGACGELASTYRAPRRAVMSKSRPSAGYARHTDEHSRSSANKKK